MGPSPSAATRFPRLRDRRQIRPRAEAPSGPREHATLSPASPSKARNASASASAVGRSTALRRSGRERVTTSTSPSATAVTASAMAPSTSPQAPRTLAPKRALSEGDHPPVS